ncbi:MAG TPA: metallophosphoesterase family protein [Devosia sp.]|nr:metallophosphoesterase family protein [Devosia sp.]
MPRPRLAFHQWPAAVYAIGDVHGCIDQLRQIERVIADDARSLEGEKWIVTIGDHIDRGPASREVIDHLMGPAPAGLRRFALMGNHEAMMLDFLNDPVAHGYWLEEGGIQTLASYGIALRDHERASMRAALDLLPAAHRAFIESLPVMLALPGWLFVHAGIRPGVPLADQTDEDLVWIRGPFLTSQLTGGLRIVHGHTPGPDVVVTPHRIDVDTHCFHSGILSAVRVTPDGRIRIFSVAGRPATL